MLIGRVGSHIVVCSEHHEIGHPVVTFADRGGFDARLEHRTDQPGIKLASHPAPGLRGETRRYRQRRRLGRQTSLDALRRGVRQVVVHFDGCRSVQHCFDVLHNQHGLSIHFMVDSDGTIYQTLDLLHCAYHAAGVNEVSVGIELQNRADALRWPNAYGGHRPKVVCRIHDDNMLAFDFTDAQYRAMSKLCGALAKILYVPVEAPGTWTTIEKPRLFRGFIGHYHVTRKKWDPGPWDFGRLFRNIGSRVFAPVPIDLSRSEEIEADDTRFASKLRSLSERSRHQGLASFPVGPLGRSRLWHGGQHLTSPHLETVRAIAHGIIVLAKLAIAPGLGSRSFVLIRHRLETERRAYTFFSLYYHLEPDVPGSREAPPWTHLDEETREELAAERTVFLWQPVDAGDPIGRVGIAGPRALRQPQIHFAIFSREDLTQVSRRSDWQVIEAIRESRFCRVEKLIDYFDRPNQGNPRDGLVDRRELLSFYRDRARAYQLRRLAVRYPAEWTPGGWDELQRMPELKSMGRQTLRRLIREQIDPTLWWNSRAAKHANLPGDGYVYAYDPLEFVAWYRTLLRKTQDARATALQVHRGKWLGVDKQKNYVLDSDSVLAMTDAEDTATGRTEVEITLEDMIDGYPE